MHVQHPDPPTQTSGRDLWRWMARIVISVLLVVVLVWRLPDVRWSDLVPEWSPSVPWWVAAALVGSAATLALQALRWGAVLRVFDRSLPASRLFFWLQPDRKSTRLNSSH